MYMYLIYPILQLLFVCMIVFILGSMLSAVNLGTTAHNNNDSPVSNATSNDAPTGVTGLLHSFGRAIGMKPIANRGGRSKCSRIKSGTCIGIDTDRWYKSELVNGVCPSCLENEKNEIETVEI